VNLIEAEQMANDLIDEHLDGTWKFVWNRSKRCFGVCSFSKKEIRLSRIITETEGKEKIRDTILHEIAHAIAGGHAGHGKVWKRVAAMIGAKPQATDVFSKATTEAVSTYGMVDTTTGKVIKHYSRKPNRNTFLTVDRMYMKGRKDETIGKLKIVKL
jgi:predicted SprT family Zn-dependent metalloprotease